MRYQHVLGQSLRLATIALVALTLISGPAFAGKSHKTCKSDDQQCLDKMAAKLRTSGWLGVETAKIDGGWYQIAAVVDGGPAAQAGLQVGDVLLAVNGVKFHAKNKAELKQAKASLVAGSTATYVVKRDGTKQKVAVTLGTMPEAQIAERIRQMIEQDGTERLAAKP